jgi:hypothetical protein
MLRGGAEFPRPGKAVRAAGPTDLYGSWSFDHSEAQGSTGAVRAMRAAFGCAFGMLLLALAITGVNAALVLSGAHLAIAMAFDVATILLTVGLMALIWSDR